MTDRRDRIHGSLFGLALGDAWGAPGEFLSVDQILGRWPPAGPADPGVGGWRVTDDTQMALAVGEALLVADHPLTAATVEGPLRAAFIAWNRSPENNRA
ncbi:MAG TPA: ADP-ribosylglycohydrolase family protein, partial [Herpetosiphonaceae bacterium]